MNQLLGILAALGAAFCWATAPSLYVLGMKDTPPLIANAIRVSAAGLFSFLFAILVGNFFKQMPFDPVQVVFLVAISFLGMGFGDWLYLRCLKVTEVSFIVGITNMYPLFVVMLTVLLGTEQVTSLAIIAAVLIVGGVFLISTTNEVSKSQHTRSQPSAPGSVANTYSKSIILAILAGGTWGISMFGLGFSLQYFSILTANAIRTSAVGMLLFLIVFLQPMKGQVKKTSRSSLTYSIIGGIFGLGIGSWLMLVAINLLDAARSSALFSVSPFFSAIVAIFVLKEKPSLTRLGGILLVCLGVFLISVL